MRAPIAQRLTRPWRPLPRALCFGFHLSSYTGVRVPDKAAALSPCSIRPRDRAHGRPLLVLRSHGAGKRTVRPRAPPNRPGECGRVPATDSCAVSRGKPRGIAEYGLGVCMTTGTKASQPERTLARDAAYLAKNAPHLVMWEYWWSKISGSGGKRAHS
jgi:hypothetical protein